MTFRSALLGALFCGACGTATPENTAAPVPAQDDTPAAEVKAETPSTPELPSLADGAKVSFISPKDGETVTTPVTIEFGLEGAEIRPAGENHPNSGHHHLIINGTSIQQGVVVPADEQHIHYGKGQTQATVPLAPGEYTLTMQFANFLHQSYGEAGSTSIKITVTE